MNTILIATDGSPEAREAVQFGIELASEQEAEVALLQVIPPVDWTRLDRGALIRPIPQELRLRRAYALDEAARWSGRAADVDVPTEPTRGAAILATSRDQVAKLGSKGFVKIGRVR